MAMKKSSPIPRTTRILGKIWASSLRPPAVLGKVLFPRIGVLGKKNMEMEIYWLDPPLSPTGEQASSLYSEKYISFPEDPASFHFLGSKNALQARRPLSGLLDSGGPEEPQRTRKGPKQLEGPFLEQKRNEAGFSGNEIYLSEEHASALHTFGASCRQAPNPASRALAHVRGPRLRLRG